MDTRRAELIEEQERLEAHYLVVEAEFDRDAMIRTEERLWEIDEHLELLDIERRAGVVEAQ